MAKKKGKTPKNEPKTLSCPCDHPFQCNCGNRPERPSRGHKWDTPTQTWTGKGHKQKGAGTTKSSTDAVVSRSGGATIEQWQKLPSQILGDICKKEGRPVLKFISQREGHGSGMRCKCIVGHPKKKGREHELIFIPSHYVRNEEQAREESALLALLTLTPRLPHERKFPEPYRTTWLNAQASSSSQPNPQNAKKPSSAPSAAAQTNSNKPAPASASVTNGSKATPQTTTSTNRPTNANAPSNHNHNQTNNQTNHNNTHTNHYSKAMASNTLQASSKYVSLAEKNRLAELKRQERNSKTHAREAKKMANRDHEVFMSAPLRKRIEDLLRQGSDTMDIEELVELEGMEAVVQEELLELGFQTLQVRRAIRAQ
eukprot:CAMPEP_0194416596 /NCGR_PEP_ID=MMETSP0176-20130528/15492_1 /TAXON_ID=216777 /ORGANISM="Proboscia alata, Strain PI-D3" /LENGTH=369 /DNA_ID=CAMNT_0039221929 /DNA_START=16 /DNA_END=1122 /DNA_ORIENTATION=+